MIFLLFLKIYEWNIRYGHKQQLSHEILLYIPLVDFLWPREIQYLQYYYLYEVKEKVKSFLCAIFVSCQIPHKFLRCLLIVGRHRELCLSTCYNCRISFWNMTQKIQPWKKNQENHISHEWNIPNIFIMIWSTLHFIYVVFSVYLFFFLLPVIDIFLIDIHIMNGFNLLFPRLWCRCCC